MQLSDEAAELWTHLLERAIHAGIRVSFSAIQGIVDRRGEWWLAPRTIDRDSMVSTIQTSVAEPDHARLLEALALDAIDPSSPFGNDLVGAITTGYVLHAYLARRDHLGVRAAVGALNGDRAIIDTPVMLRLLGPVDQCRPVERAIHAAVEAGMEVVAVEHYFDELEELLGRIERDMLGELLDRPIDAVAAAVLAGLIDDDVVRMWLLACRSGTYAGWADFRAAARELRARLTRMGVTVRPHRNSDPDEIERFRSALRRIANRGPEQIDRDANTMAMAARRRRRSRSARTFWPGAWVITTDRRMPE